MENPPENSKSLVLITRVGSTPTTGIRSSLESNDSGLLFLFQKTLHRNRLGTLYCHEGDWSWIYFSTASVPTPQAPRSGSGWGSSGAEHFLSKSIDNCQCA